jgi:hypothetical protein
MGETAGADMSALNRNIITPVDVRNLVVENKPGKTLDTRPPAAASPPGGVAVPTADDYLTKLLKFVPLEVLGVYLFIASVVETNVGNEPQRSRWLLGLLLGALAATVLYDIRVLSIVRRTQIFMSVLGVAVYVFAVGDWYATTDWYRQWYASIALPLFGLLAAIVRLKPLPPAPAAGS